MKAEYRPVLGYEGLYVVSKSGIVKSVKRDKALNVVIDRYGYLTVHLCKNNIPRYVKIHRIVAQAFIPNPDNLPQVNHKDGNKLNNCVSNLEWCTPKQNMHHAESIGLIGYKKELNSMYGKKHSDKTKLKMRNKRILWWYNKRNNETIL